jgi:hypothetical protein
MLRAAARAARAAVPTRRYSAEPFDAARAAHDLERARLALEEKKAAQALALEEKKAAQALALEEMKLQQALEVKKLDYAQGRGAWEVLFGVKRETAQMLNLCVAGVVFISSGVYLVTSQMHESKAALHVAASTANAASQDVRALISNAQRP